MTGIAVAILGCSDVSTELIGPPTTLRSRDASTRDAAATDAAPRTPAQCGGRSCACDDGKDQDGDSLVDGFDPECTGAYDDDESSFDTGAPGGDTGICRDCFWDANAGRGDDTCAYPAACLVGDAPSVGAACSSCEVGPTCVDRCKKLTPNGCDCFGCCDVTRQDGSRVTIALTAACSLADIDDATRCPRCFLHETCKNPCGTCELCPGRTPESLPALCNDVREIPRPVCDEGQPVCTDSADCGAEHYCQLGCCLGIVQ